MMDSDGLNFLKQKMKHSGSVVFSSLKISEAIITRSRVLNTPHRTLAITNTRRPSDIQRVRGSQGSFTPDASRCGDVRRRAALQRIRCERTLTTTRHNAGDSYANGSRRSRFFTLFVCFSALCLEIRCS